MDKDEALTLALAFIERVNREGWVLADFEQEMYAAIAAIKDALPLYTKPLFQELTESEMGQFIYAHSQHTTTYRSLMDFATDLNNCIKRKNT